MASTDQFEAERGRLFGIAYRMLGSATEAEEVVQDAYLRWHQAEPGQIESASAWLAKVVTNLSLKRLTSARARREQYVGTWLPEPVLTGAGQLGPLEVVEQRDSVSMALLIILERLSPVERAVYVLREAFAYSHDEIATILDLSASNTRQIYHRAKARIAEERTPTQPVERTDWKRLVEGFLAAAERGDLAALTELMAADVVSAADGGGKVAAAVRVVRGRERVGRYLLGVLTKFGSGLQPRLLEINGEPALVGLADGTARGALFAEVADGRLVAVRIVVNPDKLAFLARQLAE